MVSGDTPAADFLACCLRTYAAISSSPLISSSVGCIAGDDEPEERPESDGAGLSDGVVDDRETRVGMAIFDPSGRGLREAYESASVAAASDDLRDVLAVRSETFCKVRRVDEVDESNGV